MIYEVLQTIACGLVFGVVLIVIDTYLTNRKKRKDSRMMSAHKLFSDDEY